MTLKISAFGRTHPLSTWQRLSGLEYHMLLQRLRAGWPPEEIVGSPNYSTGDGGFDPKRGSQRKRTASWCVPRHKRAQS